MASSTAADGAKKLKGRRKLLAGVALSLGVVLTLLVLFNHRGLYHLYHFRQDRLHLEQENARLTAENDRLSSTIERLQHDPEFIQDYIRRELNFVKKNEIIFQLPPGGQGHTPAAPASPTAESPAAHRPNAAATARNQKASGESLEGAPSKNAAKRRQ